DLFTAKDRQRLVVDDLARELALECRPVQRCPSPPVPRQLACEVLGITGDLGAERVDLACETPDGREGGMRDEQSGPRDTPASLGRDDTVVARRNAGNRQGPGHYLATGHQADERDLRIGIDEALQVIGPS